MGPTLAGFLNFIRGIMGVTIAQLPDDSPSIPFSLAVALMIVNPALKCVPLPQFDGAGVALNPGGGSAYNIAAYNLAASNLLSFAQDPTDAPIVDGSGDPGVPFFAFARQQFKINSFVPGVIQAAADESTSDSYVVQEAAKNFTLSDLNNLKNPWGRAYLAIAQSFGPSNWGIS